MRHAPIDPQLFITNRERLKKLMLRNSLAAVNANDIPPTNADGSLALRQNTDLFYLTGIEQEETMLLLFPDANDEKHREVLLLREPSERLAIWEGHKLTRDEARRISGIQTVLWLSEVPVLFHRLMCECEHVYLNSNEHKRAVIEVETRDARFIQDCQARYPLHDYQRLARLMHRLRVVKSDREIALIRKACAITEAGFRRVCRFVKPGVNEMEVEAEFAHEFIRRGGQFAYNPIIASGKNACALHYHQNDQPCRKGQLLLLDVAAGYANYNALEARFQHKMSNGLSSLLSYTWSKSTDTSSGYFGGAENGLGGGNGSVQNFFDRRSAHGVSSYDITHFLSWSAIYELPFGKGKTWMQSGPLSWILGNWQTTYVFQARSGQPYNIGVSGDFAALGGNFGAPGNYLRPNLVPGVDPFTAGPVPSNPDPHCALTNDQTFTSGPLTGQKGAAALATHSKANWFNPCAFMTPIGSFGTAGRNPFRGPHVANMDFGVSKTFPLPREGMSIQFRAEAFNVFNIQNWDAPQGGSNTLVINTNAINTPLAVNGQAGVLSQLAQGTTARELQFGLRIVF